MARRAWWNWTVVFPVVDGGSGGVAPNFDPFHAFSRLGLAFLASTTTPKAQYSLGSWQSFESLQAARELQCHVMAQAARSPQYST